MQSNEAQIQALMDGWVAAVKAKDSAKLVEHYADDVLVCDLMPPLHYTGAVRYREIVEHWFQSWQSPIDCEMRVLKITASDEVAFATTLTHNSGTRGDGQKVDFWLRATIGFSKIDGQWKVTHEHVSVPFDMETMQACLDLKPE